MLYVIIIYINIENRGMKKRNLVIGGTLLALATGFVLKSCRTIPKGAHAVKPFDTQQYLGKWYEIARLDFAFEKNLNNTTAEYSLKGDGSIKVVNRGYNFKKHKKEKAVGKAKFVGSHDEAKLKVSFFGPFYAGYNVIDLDPDYKYALVAGKNLKYLWLLSRNTIMPDNVKNAYLKKAEELGYDTTSLIWVEHNQAGNYR